MADDDDEKYYDAPETILPADSVRDLIKNLITKEDNNKTRIKNIQEQVTQKLGGIQNDIRNLAAEISNQKKTKIKNIENLVAQQELLKKQADMLAKMSRKIANIQDRQENHWQNACEKIDSDTSNEQNIQTKDPRIKKLENDVQRAADILSYFEMVIKDPAKYIYSGRKVNAFVHVISLADVSSFDEEGTSYFKDEIVKVKGSSEEVIDSQHLKYGLSGKVVTRGVYLAPGEVKRSVLRAQDQESKKNVDTKIVIETSIVTRPGSQANLARVVDRSNYSSTTGEQKNQAALKFASELLLQYTEGSNDNITINGGESNLDQAKRVYAALLMLTSVKKANQDKIALDPSRIIVNVPGFQKFKKQNLVEQYFKSEQDNEVNQKNLTAEYRELRGNIDTLTKKDTSDIDIAEGDDSYRKSFK